MNLIDSIKRSFYPSNYIPLTGWTSLPNVRHLYSNERNNSAINICSRVIANTVASIPLSIYKEIDDFQYVLEDDYRYDVLHNNPNNYTTAFSFWHTMENVKQKEGNSFAIIHRFNERGVKSIVLEFVHPSLLVGQPKLEKGLLKYTFKTNNGNQTFDAANIIHFKRDSEDGFMGIDPYVILADEVKRTFLANKTITSYYENDGKSTKFIKTQVTTGDIAKLEKYTNKFREETGGTYFDDNNKIVKGDFDKIVSYPRLPGNSEIQVIPNDQNDALYLATIQNCDLKIAAHYGIPPHYLNIMQAQKNNNVETLQLDFKSSTIQHILRSNRQELQMKLLTTEERKSKMSIEYNVNAILELSSADRMRQYESLSKTALMVPNEIRKIEKMKPIKGGDEPIVFNQMTTLTNLSKDSSSN